MKQLSTWFGCFLCFRLVVFSRVHLKADYGSLGFITLWLEKTRIFHGMVEFLSISLFLPIREHHAQQKATLVPPIEPITSEWMKCYHIVRTLTYSNSKMLVNTDILNNTTSNRNKSHFTNYVQDFPNFSPRHWPFAPPGGLPDSTGALVPEPPHAPLERTPARRGGGLKRECLWVKTCWVICCV